MNMEITIRHATQMSQKPFTTYVILVYIVF